MSSYPFAEIAPRLRRINFPFTRDQTILLFAAFNEIMLGVETYVAHLTSGTILPKEWIPIIFGPTAGILLILIGLLAFRNRSTANVLASIVFFASIVVGLLGAYFHFTRAILPAAPPGERLSVKLLVWAPPILGPLTFALVGLLGLSAAWFEDPPDSGTLKILGEIRIHLPYSKTEAYFFIVGLAALATVTSSVLDHARTNFTNPWLWLPTGVGIFATVIAVLMGSYRKITRTDLVAYITAMLLMVLVGILGSILHISQNLTTEDVIVGERFLRGAPVLAPLLFSDIGTIGFLILLGSSVKGEKY